MKQGFLMEQGIPEDADMVLFFFYLTRYSTLKFGADQGFKKEDRNICLVEFFEVFVCFRK